MKATTTQMERLIHADRWTRLLGDLLVRPMVRLLPLRFIRKQVFARLSQWRLNDHDIALPHKHDVSDHHTRRDGRGEQWLARM